MDLRALLMPEHAIGSFWHRPDIAQLLFVLPNRTDTKFWEVLMSSERCWCFEYYFVVTQLFTCLANGRAGRDIL